VIDSHLAAAGIRAHSAIVLRSLTTADSDPIAFTDRENFVTLIGTLADQLMDAEEGRFNELFRKMPARIRDFDIDPNSAGGDELAQAREKIATWVSNIHSGCSKGARCTCRMEAFAEGSSCPTEGCAGEILGLMGSVARQVRAMHNRWEAAADKQVGFRAEAKDADLNKFFLPECHVNGSTAVAEEDYLAVVCLYIRKNNLEWESLCQILYVLAHEYVVHAYQGVHGSKPRWAADERCAWSEGWMDEVAWQLTELWLTVAHVQWPDWVRRGRHAVREACFTIHDRRYQHNQYGDLKAFDLRRRQNTRAAIGVMQEALGAHRGRRLLATRRLSRFSVQLNHRLADPQTRDCIVDLLILGLADPESPRVDRVLSDCNHFHKHRDPKQLIEALKISVHDAPF